MRAVVVCHFSVFLLSLASIPASARAAPLFAVEFDTGRLYTVSTTDAALTLVGETDLINVGALEFNSHDGMIYALTTGESSSLYRITVASDFSAVSAQLIGNLGVLTFEGGLAFGSDGTAYGVNAGAPVPSLFTLDLATGAVTDLGQLDTRHDFSGLGWRSDGRLLALDGAEQAIFTIDPLDLTIELVAEVTAEIGGVAGLTLLDETGYFVTAGPESERPGSNELYAFDLFTGEQTFIGGFEEVIDGVGFGGLSIVPEPSSLVLMLVAGIVLVRRCGRRGVHGATSNEG